MNWLLLRGLSRQATHWGGFVGEVSAEFGGKVLVLDLPGFGTASHLKSPLAMGEIVEHLRTQFLRERNSSAEANTSSSVTWGLFGLSFGGMVALEWMRLYPKDFAQGILVNSSLAGLCSIKERISFEARLVFLRCIIGASPQKKESMILALTTSQHTEDHRLLARWVEIEKNYPTKNLEVLKQLFISSRFNGPDTLEVPIMVLSSQGDRLVNPVCSKKISQKYSAKAYVHPKAGHDLPLDAPLWVIEKMREFTGS